MKIAVFGATGGTGTRFVQQATAAGHEIRALTRSPEKLSAGEGIRLVPGNVLDLKSVAGTIEDTGAVVCLLGRTQNNPTDIVSQGTANILDAMDDQGVQRLVVLTSIGLGSSVENLPWYARLANATVLQGLMADKARQEELVMKRSLAWTIVRPGGLTDGPRTGEYVHGVDVETSAAPISRADVAEFLLTVIEDELYPRETPLLTTRAKIDPSFLWQQARDVTRRLVRGK